MTRIGMTTVLICLLCAAIGVAEETVLGPPNGGFEEGLASWTIPEGEGMSTLSEEQAAGGKRSLKIVDTDGKEGGRGSHAQSVRVPIKGAGVYKLRCKVYPVSGSGLGIYPRLLSKDGKVIGKGDAWHRGAPTGPAGEWVPFEREVYATDEAAFLEVWFHSYSHATVEAYVDDVEFVALGAEALEPPWERQYKLRPTDTDKLTAADVVGPDGIVYPNWTQCGVPGGIPEVPVKARIEDFGGKADDDQDDSEALQKGAEEAGKQGGALLLGPGAYHLDRPIVIVQPGVVIRGAGMDQTKIEFRYGPPESGVGFHRPEENATVGPSTRIEVHCRPQGLQKVTLFADDKAFQTWQRSTHSGNTFQVVTSGGRLPKELEDGPHVLKAVAEWQGGEQAEATRQIVFDRSYRGDAAELHWRQAGAIVFLGDGREKTKLPLATDGRRGAMQIELESAEGLEAGDRIVIRGPATERWKTLTRNKCKWGEYRRYELLIAGVEGNTIRVTQPLRIEFPVIDGSYVYEVEPIRRCGVEGFTIEQTQDLWTSAVLFTNAWECWARDVKVIKCGRFPIYGLSAKWCEIRDCVFDDAWFKGGGGTAYVGWEYSCDCLMDNVQSYKMRHGPCFQWAASGNVIRKSKFISSDGQWHSGWTNENLFEQCEIDAVQGTGSYGYGMWGSPPEDTAHGPNGPRNVVYNCDVNSPKTGLWMGGMNENWLILYNRYVVGKGPGAFMKTMSFDHIIRGNVFVLRDQAQPAVALATPDCTGVELIDNRVFGGNGTVFGGLGKPAVDRGNAVEQGEEAPLPKVKSIFEWQKANVE